MLLLTFGVPLPHAQAVEFTPYYSGTVIGDPLATVSFRVRVSDQGKRRWAEFQYANVQIFYEDGTTGRNSTPTNLFRFRSRSIFHNEDFYGQANLSSFYEVRGRLLGGGRARGHLRQAVDFYNPPPPGFADSQDWSTGPVYWKARRVQHDDDAEAQPGCPAGLPFTVDTPAPWAC
jgi:hypothetical protein